MGLFTWVLWRLRDTFRPGILFGIYLVGAGLERLLIEFIRRNEAAVLGLTDAQLTAVGMMVIGVVWLVVVGRRQGGYLRAAPAGQH